jgi:Dual specificity phosphatase, catalytic domain
VPSLPQTPSALPGDELPLSLDDQVLLAMRGVTDSDLRSHIVHLRRSKLALLAEDLLSRVRCAVPAAPEAVLARLASLSSALLFERPDRSDGLVRTHLRECLWDLRVALDPHSPPPSIRASLENVRSGLLDMPPQFIPDENVENSSRAETSDNPAIMSSTDEATLALSDTAKLRSELHSLMTEVILLEELRALRLLEREVSASVDTHYRGFAVEQAQALYYAAAVDLGLDEYRVRSKSRLADAAEELRATLIKEISFSASSTSPPATVSLNQSVERGLNLMRSALLTSLEADLAERRPQGEAMLLRPRLTDIPNFVVVSPSLMRGGQPSIDGIRWLQKCGVSAVVDLRGTDRENQWAGPMFIDVAPPTPASPPSASFSDVPTPPPSMPPSIMFPTFRRRDQQKVSTMKVVNIPVEDFCAPTCEQVDAFVAIVNEAEACGGVIFAHCKAGIGRTGCMVACWRIANGESVDDALAKEQLYSQYGGGLRQESFVREYAAREHTRRTSQ